jgi:hypothetical protein
MKYTAAITQPQYVRVSTEKTITLSPNGGELSNKDAELVKASAYGKRLIDTGVLKFEGAKAAANSVQETAQAGDAEGKK